MKKMITKCLLALCLLGTLAANAQKKLVSDATFAKNGTYTTPADSADYYFTQIFPLPNGGSVSTGFVDSDTASYIAVLKLDVNGKPDPTFGKKGIALIETSTLFYESIYKVVEDKDKSILILMGDGNTLIESDGSAMLKLNAKGELDANFADGSGALVPITDEAPGAITDMVALPNGGFLTLSIFLDEATMSIISQFVQYKANGAIDSTYATQGQAVILTSPDQGLVKMNQVGKNFILSGIDFSNASATTLIVKANKKGDLDTKFGETIIENIGTGDIESYLLDIKMAADSSFICTRTVSNFDLNTQYYDVTKIKATGKIDDSFATKGTLKLEPDFGLETDFPIKAIELLNDGSVLTFFPGDEDGATVNATLYDKTGVLDSKFGDNGEFTFSVGKFLGVVFSSSLQADGKILLTGGAVASSDDYANGFVSRFSIANNVAAIDASLIDAKLSIFPNPIQQQATVTYEVQDAANTTLELIDAQGRTVQQLTSKSMKTQGKQTENVDFSSSLPAGNYVLRLKVGEKQQTMKVVKM
jgi:uncharacterized delta-60 repeat protein